MRIIKHIALVKFKSGTSDQKIAECFEDIRRLRLSIAGIEDYS